MGDLYMNPFNSAHLTESLRTDTTARFDSLDSNPYSPQANFRTIVPHLPDMKPRMITTVLDKANEALKKSAQITGSTLHSYPQLTSHSISDYKPISSKKVEFDPHPIEHSSNDWEDFSNDLNPPKISPPKGNVQTSHYLSDFLPSKQYPDNSFLNKFEPPQYPPPLPSQKYLAPFSSLAQTELKRSQELLKALERVRQEAELSRQFIPARLLEKQPDFTTKFIEDPFARPFNAHLPSKIDDVYFRPIEVPEPRAVIEEKRRSPSPSPPKKDSRRSSPGMHLAQQAYQPKPKYVEEYYEDGTIYRGEKIKGVKSGKGEFTYSDGRVYDGEWENDVKSGYGTLKSSDGDVIYEGEWKDDKFHGNGILMNDKFQEEPGFNFNRFDTLKNGWISYEGEFAAGKKHGLGTLILPKGQKFVGKFRYDKVHGTGNFYQQDGSNVTGDWEDNRLAKRA